MYIALLVALFLLNSNRIQKATEIWNECLILLDNTDQNTKHQFTSRPFLMIYRAIYNALFGAYRSISDYISAERYGRKLLALYSENGDLVKEGDVSMALAEILESQNRITDAKQLYEKAVNRKRQTGEKSGEASACTRFGIMCHKLGENLKANEYVGRALAIRTEIDDREGEAVDYGNLGTVCKDLGQYDKAKEYFQKALNIRTEIGDRNGEASCYQNLAAVFHSLEQYNNAKEYLQKALFIRTEIGDREGEGADYRNLGVVFQSLGQYDNAKEYLQKALTIRTEIGDREGEAVDYGNLGTVCKDLV